MKKLIDYTWAWNTDNCTIKEVLEDFIKAGLPPYKWTRKQAKQAMLKCWNEDDTIT